MAWQQQQQQQQQRERESAAAAAVLGHEELHAREGKGWRWEAALGPLPEMAEQLLVPNVVSCSATP